MLGAALVGMMEQAGARTPPFQGHLERRDRQQPIIDRADGPADDEPREQVQGIVADAMQAGDEARAAVAARTAGRLALQLLG